MDDSAGDGAFLSAGCASEKEPPSPEQTPPIEPSAAADARNADASESAADGGVDGRGMLFDQPDDWESRLALAQVKGGKYNADALRAFISVINDGKAAIGRFITLDPVGSADAKSRAVEQGTIVVRGQSYQRLLLWSMDDYFNNRPCPLPPMTNPYTGKLMQQGLF